MKKTDDGSWSNLILLNFESHLHHCLYLKNIKYSGCRIASGGYYGFRFVTSPPQIVERFHRYRFNVKNTIASLLKFAGYIHNHKILTGNIFGLILKNKMAVRDVFSTLSKDFCLPSRAKGIIGSIGIIGRIGLGW